MVYTIEQEIITQGSIIMSAQGKSMLPLIEPDKNLVRIVKLERKPRKYDVVLFKNNRGKYVLHRIIAVTAKGYIVRGDSSFRSDGVLQASEIIGVLDSFVRNTQHKRRGGVIWHSTSSLPYALYARVVVSRPFRFLHDKLLHKLVFYR